MSRFHLKLTCHTKNQDDLKLNENSQAIYGNTDMTEMLGLSDKDAEPANIEVLL